jgi:hypothetical protein
MRGEYLPTFPITTTTNGQFFVYNSRRQRRIEEESKKIFFLRGFFFTFSSSFFFYILLLLFAFQFSIFFSFPIPSTFILITDRHANWLNIYKKDEYTPLPYTFAFFFARCLSSSIHLSWSTISSNDLLYRMYVLFLKCYPSSQYALSVCSSDCADALLTKNNNRAVINPLKYD